MKQYLKILIVVLMFFSAFTFADEAAIKLKPVQEFITMMAKKNHFSKSELEKWFSQATIRQSIIDQMNKPAETKPWYEYKNIFLDEARIQGGVDFWEQNKASLEEAEKKYEVPSEIVVAIIGVETRYGKNQGRYPVLDALTTLAFAYPKREAFFRQELEQYLLFCKEYKYNPTELMGSYAGAMGKPQFMPSSIRQYAIDSGNKGKIDLFQNEADVIASVANYFNKHGWKKDGLVIIPANYHGNHQNLPLDANKPNLTVKELAQYDIVPEYPLPSNTSVMLLKFDEKEGDTYWLGLNNFYVITRYNRSPLYGLAVYELSKRIQERYLAQTKGV